MTVALQLARCSETKSSPAPERPVHVHNRFIYVPFGQLDRMFGKERKGILMSYDRYLELWALAERKEPEPTEDTPPVEATVASADYRGAVAAQLASFEAEFKVRALAKRPGSCPFGFQGVGLGAITVDGRGASLFTDKGRLRLLTVEEGEKTVRASFSAKVEADAGRRSLRFHVPQAAAATMTIEMPGDPDIESASAPYTVTENGKTGTTTVRLALGGRTDVSLTWMMRETKTAKEPVVLAESRLRLGIRPDALRLDADISLSILRTEISELSLTLPVDYDLVGYEVPNLRAVETTTQDNGKTVRLTFHEPKTGVLKLAVAAEAGWAGSGRVEFPRLAIDGARRHRGEFRIDVHRSLLPQMTSSNGVRRALTDIDPGDPPKSQQLKAWRAYAFWQPKYDVIFTVVPFPAELFAEVRSRFEIGEQQWSLTSDIGYAVKKGERLKLRFELPTGWDILEVTKGDQEVDWAEVAENGARLVVIDLPRKLANAERFECQVRCKRMPEGWSSDEWASREIPIPVVWVRDAAEQTGVLGIAAAPQFELSDRNVRGLRSIDVREVARPGIAAQNVKLGYTYRKRYAGMLAVTRRSPRIGAAIAQYVQVERDVFRIHAFVDYRIQYAATDELWLALPKGTGRGVDIRGPDIKEKALRSADGEEGEIWKIGLHHKRLGRYPLTVAFEAKIPSGREEVLIEPVRAPNVAREVGFIAIEASSDVELHSTTRSLIEVDLTEIPRHPTYRPASRLIEAYKWLTHPIELKLGIARYEEAGVLATVISQARYVTVVEGNGVARTHATFTVKNASTPNLRLNLPEESRLWSVIVAGKPVKPALSEGWISVPLEVADREGKTFTVKLTYETKLPEMGSFGSLLLTGLKIDSVPVTSTGWNLHLPVKHRYLSHDGNMEAISRPAALEAAPGGAQTAQWGAPLERYPGEPVPQEKGDELSVWRGEVTEYGEAERPVASSSARDRRRHPALLSMTIQIPTVGPSQSFRRLGGDPEIRLSFVSQSFERTVCTIITAAAVLLSALICMVWRVHPLFLLFVSAVLFVGIPKSVAEWSEAFCRSALLGVGICVGYRFVSWLVVKLGQRSETQAAGPTSWRARITNIVSVWVVAIALSAVCGQAEAAGKPKARPWKPGKTIYVPYDPKKLERPKTIDRIYLPYEDFLDLWDRAYPDREPPEHGPPASYTVGNVAYTGRVEGDSAVFDMRLEIECLKDEWIRAPIALSGVALRESRINNKPAALSPDPRGGFALGLEKSGHYVLTATLAAPVKKSSGSGKFSFKIPAVPTSRLRFTLPSSDLEAEAIRCEGGQKVSQQNGQSVLAADLGAVGELAVNWWPKAAVSANGIKPHVEARNRLRLHLQEGYLEARSQIGFKIARKPVDEVVVKIGRPLTAYSVSGEKVRRWAAEADDPSRIRVVLAERVSGETSVSVLAGAPLEEAETAFALPLIAAGDVWRESGTVTVFRSPDLKAEIVPLRGLRRVQAATPAGGDVPPGALLAAAFQYSRTPVSLQARVEPVLPKVSAVVDSLFAIDSDEATSSSHVKLEVKESALFETRIDLPSLWEVTDVSGEKLRDWRTAPEAGSQRVHVAFEEPVLGKTALRLFCRIPISDPANISLPSPLVTEAGKPRGSVVLAVRDGFALTTKSAQNLRPLDVRSVSADHKITEKFAPVMAYSFVGSGSVVTVSRSEVAPTVTVTTVTRVSIETGVLKITMVLRYEVRNAAVGAFSFSLPAYVGNQIEMASPEIRQMKSEVAGEGDAARRIWRLKLHAPRTGTVQLPLSLELALPEEGDIRIPRLDVLDVDRARRYVQVANQSEYVIAPKTVRGIQEVPPSEIPPPLAGAATGGAVAAYRARDDNWELIFFKEMTKLQQLIEASIDWAEIKSSLAEDGRMLSKVVYHMQNRTEQYLEIEMPEGAEIWSVFVGKEPVRPAVIQRGERSNTLIPLVKTTAADLAYDAEIVYVQDLPDEFGSKGSQALVAPKVIKVPVTQTHWSFYIPKGLRYYGFGGNMDEIIEEVKVVDKLKALVREQTKLLYSVKQGLRSKGQYLKARKNIKEIQRQVEQTWQEAKGRTDQRLRDQRAKQLGRYQKKKFEGQIVDNDAELLKLQISIDDNLRGQQEVEKDLDEKAGKGVSGYVRLEQEQPPDQPTEVPPPGPEEEPEGKPRTLDEVSLTDLTALGVEPGKPKPTAVRKAGILSIRVDVPQEGTVYHFKKLNGGAKLQFSYIAREPITRVTYTALLLLLLGAAFGARLFVRKRLNRPS